MSWWSYRPYVSAAKKKANAAREVRKLAKAGRTITPVKLASKKIAETFWGKSWCDHMESYSDYESRLPRGRTYVRNGSVVDLQMSAGKITALVSGSELYEIEIAIKPLNASAWKGIQKDCSGKIGSLLELLQGKLAGGVMEIVTRKSTGLFPSPTEIEMYCSCPDGAALCKHLAAVLYGVGARLDLQPELLFALRQVNHLDLIAEAGVPDVSQSASAEATIIAADLGDVFGIDLDEAVQPSAPKQRARKGVPSAKKSKSAKLGDHTAPKPRPHGGSKSRRKVKGARRSLT